MIKLPVFGICLGMQFLGELRGMQLKMMNIPLHGKSSILRVDSSSHPLWKNIRSLQVAHYHSLAFYYSELDKNQREVVIAHQDDLVMALGFANFCGVQFHPESFLSDQQNQLLNNLLNWVTRCNH